MPRLLGDQPLLVWGLAGFHTAVFMLTLVLLLHVNGALNGLLRGLNTLLGLGVYVVLWATIVGATRYAAARLAPTPVGVDFAFDTLLNRGLIAGGFTGVLFFGALAVGAGSLTLWQLVALGKWTEGVTTVIFAVPVLGIGSIVAFLVGMMVGLVFAVLDWLALRIARHLYRDGTRRVPAPATGRPEWWRN